MNVPQLKQAIVIGFISIDIGLIYIAASWGLADLFAKQASYDMQQWETKNIVKTDTWRTTHATLRWAQIGIQDKSWTPSRHKPFINLKPEIYNGFNSRRYRIDQH